MTFWDVLSEDGLFTAHAVALDDLQGCSRDVLGRHHAFQGGQRMQKILRGLAVAAFLALVMFVSVRASGLSGAIFTTVANGT